MEDRLSHYQKLPQAVQDFLFDTDKEQEALEALKKFGLNEDQAFDLLLLAEDVVIGMLKLTELEAKVTEGTQGTEAKEKSLEVTKELITYRLLPLDAYLPGVDNELKRLGGDPKTPEIERVEKEELTPEQFVKDSLKEANLHLSDAALQSRLEFLLVSYVRGVRNAPQTMAALGRSVKVGGLELEEGQARQLVEILDKRRAAFDIEVGVVGQMAEEQGTKVAEETKGTAAKKGESFVLSTTPPPISDLEKRLASITQSRLKDLRNAAQTKTLLGQSVLTGGLGLAGDELERVAADIEKRYTVQKAEFEKRATEQKQQYLDDKRKRQIEVATQPAKEDEELAKRYTALTGRAPQPVKPVVPRLSAASLPPTLSAAKPQVVDVKYATKLTGPLEELERLSAADFRRLASDPNEAAMKIRDKIDLLGNEAYAKKIAGIAAWKASPLNQLYVLMSQESLKTGKPIQEVSKIWKEQGKDGLTSEDVKAIVQLNATLQF